MGNLSGRTFGREVRLATRILEKYALPNGVRHVTAEPRYDHDGDPIVQIFLHVDNANHPDSELSNQIVGFVGNVRPELLSRLSHAFPHFGVREA
jgi:hypothetical protein